MIISDIYDYIYSLSPTPALDLNQRNIMSDDDYIKSQANHYVSTIEHYLSLWDHRSDFKVCIDVNPYLDDMNILFLVKKVYMNLGYDVSFLHNATFKINITI